jgi:hypothetical protein
LERLLKEVAVSDSLDIPDFLRRDKDNNMPQPSAQPKPVVYSFTLLKTADTCMYKCYRQYIVRDIPFDETPEIKWGNAVHTAMEHRLGGKPLPQDMIHWEPLVSAYVDRKARPEMKVGVDRKGKPVGFWGDGVFLRGKIDATIINGTACFVSDWKTGGSRYEDPFELECQAVMLHAMNPYLTKIAGNFVWLKENRVGQVHDLSDTRSAWAKINNKVEVIEDAMKDGDWPKNKTPLCGWCGVLDCATNQLA